MDAIHAGCPTKGWREIAKVRRLRNSAQTKERKMLINVTRSGLHVVPAQVAYRLQALMPAGRDFNEPLVAAGGADLVDVLWLTEPNSQWPGSRLRRSARPTILVIGDDPGNPDGCGGPSEWRCAPCLDRWAQAAIIHASGGEAHHYAEGVRGALMKGTLAFIETTSRHAAAWAARMNCDTKLAIFPRDGLHPINLPAIH